MSNSRNLVINELSSLRAIFMMTIFLHHVGRYAYAGYMAVAFFFVLSGFSLTIGYYNRIDEDSFSYSKFYKRRFARLFPIHWVCLLLALPLLYIESSQQESSVCMFMLNFFLIQSFVPNEAYSMSYNWVSWFLSDIMVFAILFPLLIRCVKSNTQKLNALLIAFLLFVYIVLMKMIPTSLHHTILYINPIFRLLDFFIGIILGVAFTKRQVENGYNIKKKKFFYTIISIASFVVIAFISKSELADSSYSIALLYWLPVCLLIYSVSCLSKMGGGKLLSNKYLVWLGGISYSFYMLHQLVIRYIRIVHPLNSYLIFLVLLIVILLSYFSNKYFEKPVSKWLTGK